MMIFHPQRFARLAMATPYKNRGLALIVVMLIVALCAAIAVEMSSRLQINIQKQINTQEHQQLKAYAAAAEQLAALALKKSADKDDGRFHLKQVWATETPPFPVPGAVIEVKLRDLSSCFNLNSVRSKEKDSQERNDMVKGLQRLIEGIEYQGDARAEDIANRIYDWVDEDSIVNFPGGAEEDEYMSYPSPYITPNSEMASLSELRLIAGMERELIRALQHKVCVIPAVSDNSINVNTIQSEQADILSAYLEGLTIDQAQSIISERPDEGYSDISEFWGNAALSSVTVSDELKQRFVLTSEYFSLTAQIKSTLDGSQGQFILTAILHYEKNKGVTVIARKYGGKL